jgi:hypothetical protein
MIRFPLSKVFSARPLVALLSAVVALAMTGTARGEILLEDRFETSSGTGAESVDKRVPQVGNPWSGNCVVESGRGLVHTGDGKGQMAYTRLNVPSNFKTLVVKIRYRPKNLIQFAFGFANSAPNVPVAEKTLVNDGVFWVNTSGINARVWGGLYGAGDYMEGGPVFIPGQQDEIVELTFQVENRPNGPYPCDLEVGRKSIASQEIASTVEPNFSHFFLQFRAGDDGNMPTTEVESIEVSSE